jgi:alpha-L-fucosidase
MVEECCYNLAAMTSKHSYRQHQLLRLRPARVHLYAWFSLSLALVLVVLAYSQTPNADDLVWQRSISQYTSTRKIRLEQVRRHSAHDRFQPTWKSLEQYRTPNWYRDAKFGIFVHWGVYSVPAFGSEWYPRLMYISGSPEFQHHVQTYGQQPNFGYKNFVPLFHGEKFVAQEWAKLFRESGARYVVPVAEHHDGFAMYDSKLTDWCASKMGPHRDIIGELSLAIRREGLHFGLSSHRAEHYFFFNGGRAFDSDVQDSRYAALYGPAHTSISDPDWIGHPDPAYLDDWLARTTEVADKYHPELIYFDWWIGRSEFEPYLRDFLSFYYNQEAKRGRLPVVNFKEHAMPEGAGVLDVERGQVGELRSLPWQTDTSISNQSWGYIENDTYKSPQTLVWQLIDVVSKNGNLLLNIGPRSDGTIPNEAQTALREIGTWLRVNGEAIYSTRPWRVYGEGPTKVAEGAFKDKEDTTFTAQDVRFTTDQKHLYAIALAWPENGQLVIHTLGQNSGVTVTAVSLLGSNTAMQWSQPPDGLHITLPQKPVSSYAYSFRISLRESKRTNGGSAVRVVPRGQKQAR